MDQNSNNNNSFPFSQYPLPEKIPYWKRFKIIKLKNANEDQLNKILKKYIKSLEFYFNPEVPFEGNSDYLNQILAMIKKKEDW